MYAHPTRRRINRTPVISQWLWIRSFSAVTLTFRPFTFTNDSKIKSISGRRQQRFIFCLHLMTVMRLNDSLRESENICSQHVVHLKKKKAEKVADKIKLKETD